jgi:uncharacterized membrane protein
MGNNVAQKTVLGIFPSTQEADRAIADLEQMGFSSKDISVVMRQEGGAPSGGRGVEVAKDAGAGATTGGAIGGVAGLIIGIAAITVPGLGALVAAGPLAVALGLVQVGATTLAGAITGAAAGGIIGALVGLGVPEERAKIYEEAVKKGQVLLAVTTTPEKESQVNEVFDRHGAAEICSVRGK